MHIKHVHNNASSQLRSETGSNRINPDCVERQKRKQKEGGTCRVNQKERGLRRDTKRVRDVEREKRRSSQIKVIVCSEVA